MRASVTLLAAALMAAPAAASPSSEITAANAKWTAAVAKKDMATVEAIVAPEFRLTSGAATSKESVERAVWLANLGKMQIADYRTEITDLEIHGDTAISTVTGSWEVTLGKDKRNNEFKLIDVWVHRPSGWQVVRRHMVERKDAR